jgi:DNA helicase II / ATP-dependent DNA helicase PcrA
MSTTFKFEGLYKELNTQQKQAVDAIEGPVMVIAGPGTGKTQILTLRIANILQKTDATPDSILALTFTESGVFSMRKRLVEIIGSAGYRVGIFTFHSFCNEIIRRFPDSFPKIIGANQLNDIEKISILKDIIEKSNLKKLKPFGDNFFYINSIRGKLSELKRENISPKELLKNIKLQRKEFEIIEDLYNEKGAHKGKMKGKYNALLKKIEKNEELGLVYQMYEKELKERRLYDYEDMIIETIKAFETDSDLLLTLQEEYQYVLADEHQDANNSQNRLLELLASYHKNPNLFIVGDEKQAIFRFQGASLENFLYFKNLYKNAISVTLLQNYRSYQHILDSAHSLINSSTEPLTKARPSLEGKKDVDGANKIELRVFSKQEYEYLFLAKDIKNKINDGVSPEEITVLYRNNKDVNAIMRIFEKNNIPFVIESDQNILLDNDMVKLIALLRAINSFGEERFLLPVLHFDFLNIDNLDIYKLNSYAKRTKINLYDILKSENTLKDAGVENYKKLHNLFNLINSWKGFSKNRSITELMEIVVEESGFLNHLLSGIETNEKIIKLSGFFDTAKKLVENHREYKLENFIEHIDLLEEHNILVKKDSKFIIPKKARLMTAHKSKGLEFDFVYIVGVYDKHWGNKRMIEHFKIPIKALENESDNDDDRRLFYVALTRARLNVNISYSKQGDNGELQLPSQFIEEIDSKFIKEFDTSSFESNIKEEEFMIPKKLVKISVKDKDYLNKLFKEQGLSVTALNNYLECPWNYFYSSLLRIPKASNKHMMFGTAVHRTLKDLFDKLQTGELIKKNKLLILFEDYLGRQPFSESEYKEVLEKGVKAIDGYYDNYKENWKNSGIKKILNEFKVSVLFEGIKLRGDLDKIEILDGNGSVNVVDYKTGKPKSRNVIEGNTKTSDGNYKRQLVFYKLLLDLYDDGRFNMISGEIDFVQPDEKDRYHKEKFIVIDEEIKKLKEIIKNTTKEILELSFWDRKCNKKDCHYCKIRKMME